MPPWTATIRSTRAIVSGGPSAAGAAGGVRARAIAAKANSIRRGIGPNAASVGRQCCPLDSANSLSKLSRSAQITSSGTSGLGTLLRIGGIERR